MSRQQATIWTCSYCPKVENQTGPKALSMPPSPPSGWLRVMFSWWRETAASEGRKRGEELATIERDACPECAKKFGGLMEGA